MYGIYHVSCFLIFKFVLNENFISNYVYCRALRERDDVASRVRAIATLSVLLQGPFDTGNAALGTLNLVDCMIHMAGSGDPIQEVIFVNIAL